MFTTSTHCIYTVYITQNMKKTNQMRPFALNQSPAQCDGVWCKVTNQFIDKQFHLWWAISHHTDNFCSGKKRQPQICLNYYCCYSWEALIQFFWDGPARLLSLGSVQLMASYKTAPGSHSAHIKKSSTRPCHFLGCIIKISQCSENRVYVITE